MDTLKTFKNDYIVNIRPTTAPEGVVDQLVVGAFDADDARDNIQSMLDRGVHVPSLGASVEYIVESVSTPGSDGYGDPVPNHSRPTAYIGSNYVI